MSLQYELERLYEMEQLVKSWRDARTVALHKTALAMLPKMAETDGALFDFAIRKIKE